MQCGHAAVEQECDCSIPCYIYRAVSFNSPPRPMLRCLRCVSVGIGICYMLSLGGHNLPGCLMVVPPMAVCVMMWWCLPAVKRPVIKGAWLYFYVYGGLFVKVCVWIWKRMQLSCWASSDIHTLQIHCHAHAMYVATSSHDTLSYVQTVSVVVTG